MCGIGGVAGGAPPEQALLERMAETMWRRGPDGRGTWSDGVAGLAATRLAIIDLHERSSQPMHLGSLHLVFNGEIYNYRELREELRALGHVFVTEGDTEVLLHALTEWGEGALDRINGMFAFALWDDHGPRLTLACDPFGEKPVYYAQRAGRLVFASEIKALLHDDPSLVAPNDLALAAYLSRNMMPPTGESFFAGIRRLPAAHVLRWQEGRVELSRYWHPARVEVPVGYPEAAETLRGILLDSVGLRLRSDVPVGTSLSGGIDSSTVVLLSAQLAGEHRRHAFTARFPEWARDEWRYADEVAHAAGVIEHHAVEPTADEALGDLETLVADHEEPVSSMSVYAQWRVMRAARQAGVVVLLDGQGGDELFGGYPATAGFAVRAAGPGATLREVAARPASAAQLGRSLAMDFLPRRLRRLYRARSASPYAAAEAVSAVVDRELPELEPWMRNGNPLARELLTETFETSLPQLLRYADRSSMAWSREVRLPLLDRRVAEFAFSLPPAFLYSDGVSKRILREAARGLVPEAVLARRDKVGFEPPQEQWLNEPAFRERIGELLLDPIARRRGLYDAAAVERDLRAGAWRDPAAVWRALNAEVWLREFGASAGRQRAAA